MAGHSRSKNGVALLAYVPAIHVFGATMTGGWVYFVTNRRDGILYTGATSNLSRRACEHREGLLNGFTKRYGLKLLVYCERYDDIRDPARKDYQTLAARVESSSDPLRKS